MILRDKSPVSQAAFTRTEAVFSIVGITVVAAILISWGSKVSRQNDLARCNGNLKNVALALLLFIEDNELNCLPWHPGNPAASTSDQRRNESWFHMASLSNQLISPQLLVCPADKRARIAKTWDTNPRSGFGAPRYRDQACSYAMALDAGIPPRNPFTLDDFNSVLFVDKHLDGKSSPEQCNYTHIESTGFQKALDLWWRPEMHGTNAGNVALLDGSVQAHSESMIERTLRSNLDLNSTHVLFPKRPKKH